MRNSSIVMAFDAMIEWLEHVAIVFENLLLNSSTVASRRNE
jgi:hypothetical protein